MAGTPDAGERLPVRAALSAYLDSIDASDHPAAAGALALADRIDANADGAAAPLRPSGRSDPPSRTERRPAPRLHNAGRSSRSRRSRCRKQLDLAPRQIRSVIAELTANGAREADALDYLRMRTDARRAGYLLDLDLDAIGEVIRVRDERLRSHRVALAAIDSEHRHA